MRVDALRRARYADQGLLAVPRAGPRVIRIPATPAKLLAMAAAMLRLRAQYEAQGGEWFSLEEELAYLEEPERVPDDD